MEINKTEKIEWYYPEIYDKDKLDHIEVKMFHTRASDGIRIKYESERDGYIIEQPIWKDGLIIDWKEVYFAESWKFDDENE